MKICVLRKSINHSQAHRLSIAVSLQSIDLYVFSIERKKESLAVLFASVMFPFVFRFVLLLLLHLQSLLSIHSCMHVADFKAHRVWMSISSSYEWDEERIKGSLGRSRFSTYLHICEIASYCILLYYWVRYTT